MLSYTFGKAIVVYVAFGHVYVHDLRTGFMKMTDKQFGVCVSQDSRDGGFEHVNFLCSDLDEDEVWMHILECSESECQLDPEA